MNQMWWICYCVQNQTDLLPYLSVLHTRWLLLCKTSQQRHITSTRPRPHFLILFISLMHLPSRVSIDKVLLLHHIIRLWTGHWPTALQLLVSISFVKSNLLSERFYEAAFNATDYRAGKDADTNKKECLTLTDTWMCICVFTAKCMLS